MVVKTTKNSAVAADISVAARHRPHRLNDLIHTISGRLARLETRHTVGDLIRGLLAPLSRKNCWSLAEHTGHSSPYRFQHMITSARTNATPAKWVAADEVYGQNPRCATL